MFFFLEFSASNTSIVIDGVGKGLVGLTSYRLTFCMFYLVSFSIGNTHPRCGPPLRRAINHFTKAITAESLGPKTPIDGLESGDLVRGHHVSRCCVLCVAYVCAYDLFGPRKQYLLSTQGS
jgi:hypothetical protein